MGIHGITDNPVNIQKSDLLLKEKRYCAFICRIENRGHTSADSSCFQGHRQSQEGIHIRIFKSDLAQCGKVQTITGQEPTFRIIQCILDRKLHIRSSKLCHYSAIFEFHHRMNDTLRLNHHLNVVNIHIKEPLCLHYFQSLVYQCSRIDRNLLSHGPVRMFQCILYCYFFQICRFHTTKRSAGCGNQQFFDSFSFLLVHTLKNCAVFAVHRKNLYIMFFCQLHDQMTGSHQRLFVCQRNVFACFDGFHGGPDTDHTNNGRNQNLHFFHSGQFHQTIHTGYHFRIRIGNIHSQLFCRIFIPYSHQPR